MLWDALGCFEMICGSTKYHAMLADALGCFGI